MERRNSDDTSRDIQRWLEEATEGLDFAAKVRILGALEAHYREGLRREMPEPVDEAALRRKVLERLTSAVQVGPEMVLAEIEGRVADAPAPEPIASIEDEASRDLAKQSKAMADTWLIVATDGLCEDAKERISTEIESHYYDAVVEAMSHGHTEDEAHAVAYTGLGPVPRANKAFRRTFLTQAEMDTLAKFAERQGTPAMPPLLPEVLSKRDKDISLRHPALRFLSMRINPRWASVLWWLAMGFCVGASPVLDALHSWHRDSVIGPLLTSGFFVCLWCLMALVDLLLVPHLLRTGSVRRAFVWQIALFIALYVGYVGVFADFCADDYPTFPLVFFPAWTALCIGFMLFRFPASRHFIRLLRKLGKVPSAEHMLKTIGNGTE